MVSTQVLAEVERNLIDDFPRLAPAGAHRRVGQMRDALSDQIIAPGSLDSVPESINQKDRHVVATALAGEASVVVTNDKQLRAEIAHADIDVVAMSADTFAAHLWRLMPDELNEVIDILVTKRTRQPITAEELMGAMRGPFPTMSDAWFTARE